MHHFLDSEREKHLKTKNIKNEPFEPKKWAPDRPTKSWKMYLHRIFYCGCTNKKNEPLAMFRKNELNICWYKYKNRLTTTQTKEEILICSLWHLLEVVFRSSEVLLIEHCRATPSPLGTKLKDAVVLYVSMIHPYRSLKELPWTIPKSAKQIAFPKNCPPTTLPGLIPYE